jgi:tRNA(Ile)-lysidine synthetase, N-terminal domain/tRNA(Ile)-lysidine synthetase, C-terminal domain
MQCPLEKQVQKSLEKLGVTGGSHVGVAVSGGVDSMALLHCLCNLRAQMNIRVSAYHMEHGIRAESEGDMRFVKAQCGVLNVPCIAASADVPAIAAERHVSVEAAARDARYAFLDAQYADFIATAHHMDDLAETVLLNLLRGSGLAGLCGIPERRGKYIRPLLGVSRRRIEAYARAQGIGYVHDATNDDTGYTRNYIRRELLPRLARVNRGAAGNIARTAALLAEDEAALMDMARRAGCITQDEEGAQVDIDKLTALMPAVQKRVIRLAVQGCCGLTDIESVHIDALLDIAKKGKSAKRADLGRGCFAAVVYGKLLIGKAGEKRYNNAFKALDDQCEFGGFCFMCEPFTGTPQFGACAEYFDADALKGAVLRHRRRGDVIMPLGMAGGKRLSDYLSDRKVPLHKRDALVLLAKGSEVLWAVGVGVSEKSRVRPDGKMVKINYGENGYARGHQKDTIRRGADQAEGEGAGSPDTGGL